MNKDIVKTDTYSVSLNNSTVCVEGEYVGDISFGVKTAVHPKARIIAETGPIIFGDGNIIEERTVIINKSGAPMYIGHNNVFEVGCRVEAAAVGDGNTFECGCVVGRGVTVTRGCVIGAKCRVLTEETVPENCVIYGSEQRRRVQSERPQTQVAQCEFLNKVLPNYHYTLKVDRPQGK